MHITVAMAFCCMSLSMVERYDTSVLNCLVAYKCKLIEISVVQNSQKRNLKPINSKIYHYCN